MSIPGSPAASDDAGGPVRAMSVWSVAALGIGSMVGAGVFALLGQVALLVHGETWIAFALGGVAALFSGYSYARLGARYPSRGGIIDYFHLGLGPPLLARTLSILYLVTLALTVAMVAKAFGAYAARIFHDPPTHLERVEAYSTGIIVVLAVLNMVGSAAVGRVELGLVIVKLSILGLLIAVGAATLHPAMLQVHRLPDPNALLAAVGLAFFAYAGYGMMANAAADVPNPERSMPRAFMLAIGVVLALYVTLALVVLGNVSPETLARYADTAVAEAAAPILGHAGFVLVSVAALLATASAINATLYSIINITHGMGQRGALPAVLVRPLFGQGTTGLLVLLAIILVLTNFLNLNAIASVASATFLACYLAVFVAAWRLRQEIGASATLLVIGFAIMAVVFGAFIASLVQGGQLIELGIIIAACLLSGVLALLGTSGDAATPAPGATSGTAN